MLARLRRTAGELTRSCPIGRGQGTARCVRVDDLTKELWQGVAERVNPPEPVYRPALLVAEPPPPFTDGTSWREFLVSRKLAAILAFGCVLGLLGIVSANPFASASVSERVSDKLGQPATCAKLAAPVTADSDHTIYRCVVGRATKQDAQCFAVSGRDIRQLSGRRELRC